MPNYNQTLQTNNSSLEEIITQLNAFPDAGYLEPPTLQLQNKTVTPSTSKQTITADSGYDGLDTVTVNAMPIAAQAVPSILINTSTGLITATATQAAGYVVAGTKSTTKQLAFQPAKTITPSATSQIAVSSGYYTGGNITVAGDSNLVAGNIKNGITIFGVNGTYEGGGGSSSGDTNAEDALITREIATYTNNKVSTIGSYAFAYCSRLTSISLPVCTNIRSYAFAYCSSLTSISLPVCTNIRSYAFNFCSSLTSISLPVCTNIGSYAFRNCSNLTSISLPVHTTIGNNAFQYCSKLTSIYLGAFAVCTLSNSNVFSQTGIWSNKGSIFVPASLVASYKKATNWVFFSNRIFSYAF